jgi:hypothetical protein
MIGVVAVLKVQPDKAADFEKVFLDLQNKVKANEPGCLVYQLTRAGPSPASTRCWSSTPRKTPSSTMAARTTSRPAGAAMGPFMAGRPEIEYLDAVE